MKKYSLTLNEGQMDCLIRLIQAGLNQCKTDAMHTTHLCTTVTGQPPTVEQADNILDAFARGPKLLALLEEHKALGPQPVYEEEEL